MIIAVFGAKGRVGRRVCDIAKERGHTVWEIDKQENDINIPQTPLKGVDAMTVASEAQVNCIVDVVIDFSVADATEKVVKFCKAHHCPLVTGTTGRNNQQQACIDELKGYVTVCEKANFSQGIFLVEKICQMLAPLNWDCDVIERHRKGKADRPSGTAKQLYKTLLLGGTRTVCVHSVRNGSNFGQHEIVFGTQGESITIIHQAENVDIFARGALDEAEKIVNKM